MEYAKLVWIVLRRFLYLSGFAVFIILTLPFLVVGLTMERLIRGITATNFKRNNRE